MKALRLHLNFFRLYLLVPTLIPTLFIWQFWFLLEEKDFTTAKIVMILKILCSIPIYYITYIMRRNKFYYFYNLNLSGSTMWAFALLVDFTTFFSGLFLIHYAQ